MLDISDISKVGIGTWGIGGFAEPDPDNDDARDIAGLHHWFAKGANYLEVPFFYARGRTGELIAEAIKTAGVPRESLFVTLTVYPHRVPKAQGIYEDFQHFCKLFQTDYADSLQITMAGALEWGVEETFTILEDLLRKQKIRYVNVTNTDKDFLEKLHRRFGEKLFAHELHFNFEIRINDDLDIVSYADVHHIRNVIAQPLRRNRTAMRNWPLLVELAKKYKATQNQILIAWLVARGMLPIPKATDIAHIDEIWAALGLELEQRDVERLNDWRPPHYQPPLVDWKRPGENVEGTTIDQLPNVFDTLYDAQNE